MRIARKLETIFIHSNRFVPIDADALQRISFFTHSTIDCHITMQLAATNRYIYQPLHAARDKYIHSRIS